VNWDLLERRIASSEKAYQRQIIRKKIDELVQYYEQCRQARDLPSIPGAVIISCDEKLSFEPAERADRRVGTLKVPEREGILRAIDGQHRLLALHADIDRFGDETSPCRRSSSTGCPKITSCRCSSRSTRSTRG
jgi:DGQHR domain-containing protein